MDLKTADTAAVAREVVARYASRGVGVVGGLVSRADGSQEPHNFGPSFSLRASLTSWIPLLIDHYRDNPRLAGRIRDLTMPAMKNWPNVLEPATAVQTYWLHEGNVLIYSDVLRSLGGYDPAMREHETQDFAIRLEKSGIGRQFDPSIEVVHHHVDVRGRSRPKKQLDAALYIMRKHGLRRWLTD
jgi:N-acetylglucosaminyl-diphospho-decaprenol L-rhamnosyltransferase